jgi:Holliday junction resolvase RusA-like endonuclease
VSITVVLPLPPAELKPNARPHYMAKAKRTKQYRAFAWAAGRCASGPRVKMWKAARVSIRWYSKTKRRPDADNALASLKAAFDGFTDAGVWADDRNTSFDPIVFAVDKAQPRVEFVISEVVGGEKESA